MIVSLNKQHDILHIVYFVCLRIIVLNVYLLGKRRAIYDQFGEEGLKGGVPDGTGGFTSGYTFHGDPFKVFSTFFGGTNPFAGKLIQAYNFLYFLELQSFLMAVICPTLVELVVDRSLKRIHLSQKICF